MSQKKPATKKNVYITQFNTPSARNLMPLAAGLLYSYAETIAEIKELYDFKIEIMRETPDVAVSKYQDPYILAFSAYFWNFNQSILVAKAAKKKFPNVPIIFGGPSAPLHRHDTINFFKDHPYVDAVVAGEGEVVFADILMAMAQGKDFSAVDGVSYRSGAEVVFRDKRDYIKDVSMIPSPFLNGVFDKLLARYKEHITGVVWETNRGCPFTCSFCFWGGPDSKISQFPMDRVYAELDWISRNKISYIFGADANFGILKRDLEIATYMAKLNRETGYPKFFVINWTKNSTEKIFEIVDVLKESEIKFMMTTSVQSHNPDTLKAVKRANIRLEAFNRILEEASKRNFETYSELILGLPLETYATFIDGIRKVLSPNLHYHFNLYQCVLIPGTEMSEPEYVAKYDIQTRHCMMNLGRALHETGAVPEYQDIVVGTSTMPTPDWKRSHTIGYMTKSLYGFRTAFFALNYLKQEYQVDIVELMEHIVKRASSEKGFPVLSQALRHLSNLQDSIISGSGNETIKIPGVGASLHPESAVLVTVLDDKRAFYNELHRCIESFMSECGHDVSDDPKYQEVMAYQYAVLPSWSDTNKYVLKFQYNVSDYFQASSKITTQSETFEIGEGAKYKDIDEFLAKQIYGGMVFGLLKAKPANNAAAFTAAQDFFKSLIVTGASKTVKRPKVASG